MEEQTFDFIVIGSGFGGSVSAMRLSEKGYRVLVLERGKRWRDQDFPKTNWNIFKFLWVPALRCLGCWQFSFFRNVLVMHFSGVGGGSLGYCNVLMVPNDKLFANPAWKHLADWKSVLAPHYETARRMLGVAPNPRFWHADGILKEIAGELGREATLRTTTVGVFFEPNGQEGQEHPDPYFNGLGPSRNSCTHCGGCMVGCRYNAKNTLVKNYLYFAEKWGVEVRPECLVTDVRPLPAGQPDGARYEVVYQSPTAWLFKVQHSLRARNVVFSAGTLGTLRLLFRCRDVTRSLPNISPRLGDRVRTNSETLLGSCARDDRVDYSKGISITSIFDPDEVTAAEPVRFPAGSSLIRLISSPLIDSGDSLPLRWLKTVGLLLLHPIDTLRTYVLPGWARHTTILLVMQTEDNRMHFRLGRSLFTLWRKNLVSLPDVENMVPRKLDIGHQIVKEFGRKTNGVTAGSFSEGLFNIPITAHILGGCPFGLEDREGVVGLDCQIHNYPGLYVVDGAIMPGNPGVNPSLTITALAEYAMSRIPPKAGAEVRSPLGVAGEAIGTANRRFLPRASSRAGFRPDQPIHPPGAPGG